jgi:hypothetical protein
MAGTFGGGRRQFVRSRSVRLVAALAMAAGLVGAVRVPHASSAPTRVWAVTTGKIVESSPLIVNLDGQNDVVVGSEDKKVYALHGSDGSPVGGWPQVTSSPIGSSAAAADTDGDGKPELFIGAGTDYKQNGGFYSFSANGGQRFRFQPTDKDNGNLSVVATPAIGDTNGDKVADVTASALGLQSWSLSQAGDVNPGWPFYTDDTVFSSAALVDVNGDGQTDIVTGGDVSPGAPVDGRGGILRAIAGDGRLLWSHQFDEIVRSSPSIGDVDGDGKPEIVVGSGNYWVNHCKNPLPADCRGQVGANDATKLFVFDLAGNLEWSKDLGAQTLASPALADINGDGRLDIAEGTWEGASAGQVWALDGVKGDNLPGYPRASGGGIVIGGITTADLNGDGAQDLLVPTGGAFFAYDGKNGSKMFGIEEGQVGFQSSAAVADIDGNGRLDIIVAGTKPSTGQGVVERWELGAGDNGKAGAKSWPMFRFDARRTGNVDPPSLGGNGKPIATPATTAKPAATKATSAPRVTAAPVGKPAASPTTAAAAPATIVAATPSTTTAVTEAATTSTEVSGQALGTKSASSKKSSSSNAGLLAAVAVVLVIAAAVVGTLAIRSRKRAGPTA